MNPPRFFGHGRQRDLLGRLVQTGKLPHALLFTGPPGIGKRTLAEHLASAVSCEVAPGAGCGACFACHCAASLSPHPDITCTVDISETLWLRTGAIARLFGSAETGAGTPHTVLAVLEQAGLLAIRRADDDDPEEEEGRRDGESEAAGDAAATRRQRAHEPAPTGDGGFVGLRLRAENLLARKRSGEGDELKPLDELLEPFEKLTKATAAASPRPADAARALIGLVARGAYCGSIKIGMVRRLQELLKVKAYRARTKVVIVDGAHKLGIEAQNALLKTLEEPPGESLLILVTPYPDTLVEPIRSRCQQLRFGPLRAAEMLAFAVDAELCPPGAGQSIMQEMRRACGSPGALLEALVERRRNVRNREHGLQLLECWWRGREPWGRRRLDWVSTVCGPEGNRQGLADGITELLGVLLELVRDAIAIRAGAGEPGALINADIAAPLAELATSAGDLAMDRFALAIDETIAALAGYADPRLTLERFVERLES
ncbi:MAG: hypothetical protein HYV63_18345 [Candidatus Schekmanbacteria bacterium]|nr:hypothetical protein [Candidatus Schekmanbacteria bacterium]